MLTGLLPLETGQVVLDGRVLDDPAQGIHVPTEDRSIGVVFQDLVLFPSMDVLDNVAFGLRAAGWRGARPGPRRWLGWSASGWPTAPGRR